MRLLVLFVLCAISLVPSGLAAQPLSDSTVLAEHHVIIPCPACGGQGVIVCSHCKSQDLTKETCSHCRGVDLTQVACSHCNGVDLTVLTCPTCRGQDLTKLNCTTCRGTGKLHEYYCYACDGTGKRAVCFACSGTGKRAPCYICNGTGRRSACYACNGTGHKSNCFVCDGKAGGSCTLCSGSGTVVSQLVKKETKSFRTPFVAENGSYHGELNDNGVPKTVYVRGYYRKDGSYVRSHFRSPPNSNPEYTFDEVDGLRGPGIAENGSYYGETSKLTGRPKTVYVNGYYRKDGTYVRGHYRSKR